MDDNWARERVSALLRGNTPQQSDPSEMKVEFCGVRITIKGSGVALLLAPGVRSRRTDEES